jgi:hypothetical protein
LTGTPLENKLDDIIGIFGFIKPGLFKPSETGSLSPAAVRTRYAPYSLRRRKEEALPELPNKIIDTKMLELTDRQRDAYEEAEGAGVNRLRQTKDVTVQHVLALIQQLKQICNFDPDTSESCKMDFLLEDYLEGACDDNQKTIIISQYVRTLALIAGRLRDYHPLTYTGDLSVAQRDRVLKDFETEEMNRILLLSLKAGGVGLNLTRANYVLHFDRWWNPAVERQAEDRVHRIGQLRRVFVTRVICEHTIEERIEQLLQKKKLLFQQVVDELADVSLERVLSEEELFGLFNLTPPSRARREATSVVPEEAAKLSPRQDRRSEVIKPEEPFSNIAKLRQVLRESEEFIWWADTHFSSRGLEELIVTVDPSLVHQIRILSGPANADERAKRDFARFRQELHAKGIEAEWRVAAGFSHDRFILSKSECYNVPPVNSLLRGQYSEILETPNRPPFEEWWSSASPIDDARSG